MNVFVDTNIFLDSCRDRSSGFNPTNEFAFQFFKQAIECKFYVLICKEIVFELMNATKLTEKDVFKIILNEINQANKLILIEHSKIQLNEAISLAKTRKIPLTDCLLAVLARDNNTFVVTRDNHFLEELVEIVEVKTPEELL